MTFQTYTPPAGNTPQALQLQQGAESVLPALQKVSGASAQMAQQFPSKVASQQIQTAQNVALPQANTLFSGASGDAFSRLDAARQDLNTKYGDPLSQALQQTPGYDPSFLATHPIAPNIITSVAGSDMKSGVDMLNSISDYISKAYDTVNTSSLQYQNTLKMLIDSQNTVAGQYLDLYKSLLSSGLTQKDLIDLKLQAAQSHLKPVYDTKGNIVDFTSTFNNPLVMDLGNKVFSGQIDFENIDPSMQQAVRDYLKEIDNTTPEQLKKDLLAQKKANVQMRKQNRQIVWQSVGPFGMGGQQGFVWDKDTNSMTPINTKSGVVILTNPDTGEMHSWNVGDPEIQTAVQEGWMPP